MKMDTEIEIEAGLESNMKIDVEIGAIVIAQSASIPLEESELAFALDDCIEILDSNDGWYYGEILHSRKGGWFDVSLCKRIYFVSDPDFLGDENARKAILEEIIKSEDEFVATLGNFYNVICKSILLQDNAFKRSFHSNPAVGVTFDLVNNIHKACSKFLSDISKGFSSDLIGDAFKQFAPSLRLFAQYEAEYPNVLHALRVNERELSKFLEETPLPNSLGLDFCLPAPLHHYKEYLTRIKQLVDTFSSQDNYFYLVLQAMDAINVQTDLVIDREKQQAENLALLALQNKFAGDHVIFQPSRKLLKEGELLRIKKGGSDCKAYYIHLFNDCIMYSTRSSRGFSEFKLHKTICNSDLLISYINDDQNVPYGISIGNKIESEKPVNFVCKDHEELRLWFEAISDAIPKESTKKNLRTNRLGSIVTTTMLFTVDVKSLGPRGSVIYKFLSTEISFANSFWQLNTVMIQPLIAASTGAALCAVNPNGSLLSVENKIPPLTKYQTQQIFDSLQSSDIKMFLRAAESLASALQEFEKCIEDRFKAAKWSDDVCIGSDLLSSGSQSYYHEFKSYASTQPLTLRVLRDPLFSVFYKDVEALLVSGKGSLNEKIEFPRDRISVYLRFARDLLSVTSPNHPDYVPLTGAVELLEKLSKEVTDVVKSKENFEKILLIQKSLTSSVHSSDADFIERLASTGRTFIKEGDLKKVCRKKNKMFRFWLFNDFLIYAEATGSENYCFHRSIDLSRSTVSLHQGDDVKHAIDILGADKSFVAIAPSQSLQQEWYSKIADAISAAKSVSSVEGDSVAPLWVPDSGSNDCMICKQVGSLCITILLFLYFYIIFTLLELHFISSSTSLQVRTHEICFVQLNFML